MKTLRLLLPLLALTACASTPLQPPVEIPQGDPWSAEFEPHATLDTQRMHLEVLRPAVADLDYAAFMSSREHLQRTMHWGSWPSADATVEQNRKDLARHLSEFEAREAYAYTVLTPDRSECIGCIYMNASSDVPGGVNLAYWVVEKELATDLDRHLIASVIEWVETSWPFDTLVMRLHIDNERGIRIAQELGLELQSGVVQEHRELRWDRL